MTAFPNVRVAAIQATPVILDAERCVQRAEQLLNDAADQGAQLAVLPECFIPLYPSNMWARGASGFGGWDELWEQLWANAVDVPGPLIDRLIDVCRDRELFCGVGVNERESERPGTLYNTFVYLGPTGSLGRHRKLMPTQHERLFHGIGAGDDLARDRSRRCTRRRADLLGEPDAARPIRGLPRRTSDLARPDGR